MDCQSTSSDLNVVVGGNRRQGNISVTVEVINELREKINNLQRELRHLQQKEIAHTTDSLFHEDLNKIKSGLKVCSNAIQSANDLFKSSNEKNTEMSNELKALKRKVNKHFDEEKDLGKSRNEQLDFLNEGMGKLQHKTERLGNEFKKLGDGLKEEHERVEVAYNVTESTKDLIKSLEKRMTETSNKVKALEKDLNKFLSVRTEAFVGGSVVKEEDLTNLRNGVLNVYSRGIQQVHEINKDMSNEIKTLHQWLKKQQVKVDRVVQSTILTKKQHENINKTQIMTEKFFNQFSSEIENLQIELKAEQEKNIILENKLTTIECRLKEVLIRNDFNQNPNPVISTDRTHVTNISFKDSAFVADTCKLVISDSQTKEHDQMDMQSNFATRDSELRNIVSKSHNQVSFNEAAKTKYVCEGINQKDNAGECRDNLSKETKVFYEKLSSCSSVFSQTDESTENEYKDLAFDSTCGKEGALSYLDKAHAYLQNLQMPGMFTFSDEESSAIADKESSVMFELENNAGKLCGKVKKKKKKTPKKKKEKRRDKILSDKIEWVIRRNVAPVKDQSYQSRVFYTGKPGYRLQVLAKIDQPKEEVFFCLRVLKGVYDENVKWPCQQGISIKISEKMQSTAIEYCLTLEKDVLEKPKSKSDKVYTKWLGPFILSHYLSSEKLIFDIYLG